ncbi:MAG: hypothetical protein GY842_12300 [bacterium]|nr:hypothetical protein [bacterium]
MMKAPRIAACVPRARAFRRRRLVAVVAAGAWLLPASGPAQGQLVPDTVDRALGITGVGRVGNTAVSNNTRYTAGSRGAGGLPGSSSFGGSAAGSGNGLMLGGGSRQRASLFSPMGSRVAMLANPLAYQFTRPVAPLPPTGGHMFTGAGSGGPLRPSRRNMHLFRRSGLLRALGNTAPTRLTRWGHEIRDGLAQESLDNLPAPESYQEDAATRRTYSEIMAERITAAYFRALADGWRLLREGENQRSIRRFESASLADPTSAEAVVGMVLAASAGGNTELGTIVLARGIRQSLDMFEVDVNLLEVHPDPEAVARMIAALGRQVRQSPDNVSLTGVLAFLTWFTGQREEALRIADRMYEEHRTTPLAAMAAQMRGEDTASFGVESAAFGAANVALRGGGSATPRRKGRAQ